MGAGIGRQSRAVYTWKVADRCHIAGRPPGSES